MKKPLILWAAACLLAGGTMRATTFIVGTDDELVTKSEAIIVGEAMRSYSQRSAGTIETVTEFRVERSIKGRFFPGQVVSLHSPGGWIDRMGVVVPGAAVFKSGERDLLFLNNERGQWQTVDMMIGKFRFARTTRGEEFLVRDYDDVEMYDRSGAVHGEPLRRERQFLKFVEEKAAGRLNPRSDYLVSPALVPDANTLFRTDVNALPTAPNLAFPAALAATYANHITCGGGCPPPLTRPIRWASFGAGIQFRKNTASGLTGAVDGGVAVMAAGLAAWNDECGSAIQLTSGSATATVGFLLDGINVIEFNDPRSQVSGSCGGGGCVAASTQMAFNDEHTFAGVPWWTMFDADIIFNDGYAQATSTQAVMNHELGHALGFRHSNASYLTGNDGINTCNAGDSECTTTDNSAIMFWRSLNAGPTLPLMDWDKHAAQTVYPGGSCSARKDDFNNDSKVDLIWRNTVTGQNAIWYMSGIDVVNTTFITGAADPWDLEATGDLNNDGHTDLIWRNYTTGGNAVWFMNGVSIQSTAFLSSIPTAWQLAGSADFNADGFDDLVWRNTATGQNALWYMSGATVSNSIFFNDLPLAWSIEGAADFDQNGQPDLILRNYTSGQNAVWYFTNSVLTSTAYIPSIPTNWNIEAVGDFDANSTIDLLFRDQATGQNAMWFLNGVGGTNIANSQFMVGVATVWRLEGGR